MFRFRSFWFSCDKRLILVWLSEERLGDGFVGRGVFVPCFGASGLVMLCPCVSVPCGGEGGSCESPSWEPKRGSAALPRELIKRINPGDAQFRWGCCRRIYKVIKNVLMESTNHL